MSADIDILRVTKCYRNTDELIQTMKSDLMHEIKESYDETHRQRHKI